MAICRAFVLRTTATTPCLAASASWPGLIRGNSSAPPRGSRYASALSSRSSCSSCVQSCRACLSSALARGCGGPGGLERDPAIIHEQPVAAHRDPLRHAAVAGQDHALRIDVEVVAAFDVAVDVVGMGIAGQQRRREEAQGATHAHLHRSGSVGRSTPLSRTRSIRARSTCLWTGPSCSSRWRASSDRPPVIACAAVGLRGESVTDGGAHEATGPSAVGLRPGWRGDGNRKRPLAAHSKH